MKIERYNKNSKRDKIRDIVGLPPEVEFPSAQGVVCENLKSENTFFLPPIKKNNGIKDYCASCGSISANTEVNAENQGVQSEVPIDRKSQTH